MYLDAKVKERSAGNTLAESVRWRSPREPGAAGARSSPLTRELARGLPRKTSWRILWWLRAIAENVVQRDWGRSGGRARSAGCGVGKSCRRGGQDCATTGPPRFAALASA